MITNSKINNLQNKIGYNFKDDNLLIKALTHPSHDNINNNQFLEYLGDSLLDFLVAEYLYLNNPDMHEGEATKMRSKIVSRWPLATLFDDLNLLDVINIQNVNLKSLSVKVRSDFIEAILGAIYIDGGINSARKFVLGFLCDNDKILASPDYKSKLYEYCAKNSITIYFECTATGAQHKQHFYSTVYLNDKIMGVGEGNNKREAEQKASQQALEKI